MLTLGLTPARDEAQEAIEQIDAFSTAAERDRAYVDAARAAALKGDERARTYADKIRNEHLRKRVLAFVDFVAVREALGRRGAEEAYRRAREGDLLPFQRVWAFTEAARLLEKSSPARAAELLGEARTEARRIDPAEAEHAYALIAVATHFLRVDHARGWEVAVEAVKAANGVERFEGEYGKLTARLLTRHVTAVIHADAPAFTLTELFGSLAAEDLNRAVELAKSLKGESPRALATMAVAGAVLKRGEVRESR